MNYIAHHGILGQKWGVRRYQNYDGSYTKKGLERYKVSKEKYDTARDSYKESKKLYKEGAIGKDKLKADKKELRVSRRDLNKSYKKLEKDYNADKGKDLYSSGKTVGGYDAKQGWFNLGSMAAAGVAGMAVSSTGKRVVAKLGNTVLNMPAGQVVALAAAGSAAIASGIYFGRKRKQLRAYYGHSS